MKLKLLPYLLLFCLLLSVQSSAEQIKFKRYSVADGLPKYDRRGDRFANYVSVQYTSKNTHELFPIPQRDMDLMSQFKQNTGWK